MDACSTADRALPWVAPISVTDRGVNSLSGLRTDIPDLVFPVMLLQLRNAELVRINEMLLASDNCPANEERDDERS
jgi:hypothetical protein